MRGSISDICTSRVGSMGTCRHGVISYVKQRMPDSRCRRVRYRHTHTGVYCSEGHKNKDDDGGGGGAED